MAERTKPYCQHCGAVATNLIAFRPPTGFQLWTSCDANACLEEARRQAAGDDEASITRIRNSAALFYRPKPAGPPDHEPPYVCAVCRKHKHLQCLDQVPIRKEGKLQVVRCDCMMNQHALDPEHQPVVTGL